MIAGLIFWVPDFILFGILPLLFLGGLIVIGVLLIGSPNSAPTSKSTALSILEERYARGEITRDEFVERREVLRGNAR